MVANGTCHGCRALGPDKPPVEAIATSPLMFAVGPNVGLSSDDRDARIRRHMGYGRVNPSSFVLGFFFIFNFFFPAITALTNVRSLPPGRFTMDLVRATGPGGVGAPRNATSGAALLGNGEGLVRDSNKAATAHGILFVIVALAVAPFDMLIAGAFRRWSWLHGFTGSVYFLFVIGAMVPGVLISREHIMVCCTALFPFRPFSPGVLRTGG